MQVTSYKGIVLFIALLMTSCINNTNTNTRPVENNFRIKSLAKSDIDEVLDIHVREMNRNLQLLMTKLYKRNPRELKKNKLMTARENIVRVFELKHDWNFRELSGKKKTDAIDLSFDDSYKGDRVFAFIVGLTSMVMSSYDYKDDFYFLDQVDPQKLYNSARNLEIAFWRLKNKKDQHGELFLYSNSLPGEEVNLSYERLFGKLIATQDNMAIIIAGKTNRLIKTVVQKMATAVFLPI